MGKRLMFVYEFSVWPDETWKFNRSIFQLFEMFGRFEVEMSEKDFESFRSNLTHHGITLREITRKPFSEREIVL